MPADAFDLLDQSMGAIEETPRQAPEPSGPGVPNAPGLSSQDNQASGGSNQPDAFDLLDQSIQQPRQEAQQFVADRASEDVRNEGNANAMNVWDAHAHVQKEFEKRFPGYDYEKEGYSDHYLQQRGAHKEFKNAIEWARQRADERAKAKAQAMPGPTSDITGKRGGVWDEAKGEYVYPRGQDPYLTEIERISQSQDVEQELNDKDQARGQQDQAEFSKNFPTIDPSVYHSVANGHMPQAIIAHRIQQAAERHSEEDETDVSKVRSARVPFVGFLATVLDKGILNDSVEAIKSGKGTERDYDVVGRSIAEQKRSHDAGMGERLGQMLAGLPGFALEIASTAGGAGAAKAAVKGGIIKVFGKGLTSRLAGTGAGILAQGVTQAALMPGHAISGAAERIATKASLVKDEDGNPHFVTEKGEDAFPAVLKAFTDHTIQMTALGSLGKAGEILKEIGPNAEKFVAAAMQAKGMKIASGASIPGVLDMRLAELAAGAAGTRPDYGTLGNLIAGNPEQKKDAFKQLLIETVAFSIAHGVTTGMSSKNIRENAKDIMLRARDKAEAMIDKPKFEKFWEQTDSESFVTQRAKELANTKSELTHEDKDKADDKTIRAEFKKKFPGLDYDKAGMKDVYSKAQQNEVLGSTSEKRSDNALQGSDEIPDRYKEKFKASKSSREVAMAADQLSSVLERFHPETSPESVRQLQAISQQLQSGQKLTTQQANMMSHFAEVGKQVGISEQVQKTLQGAYKEAKQAPKTEADVNLRVSDELKHTEAPGPFDQKVHDELRRRGIKETNPDLNLQPQEGPQQPQGGVEAKQPAQTPPVERRADMGRREGKAGQWPFNPHFDTRPESWKSSIEQAASKADSGAESVVVGLDVINQKGLNDTHHKGDLRKADRETLGPAVDIMRQELEQIPGVEISLHKQGGDEFGAVITSKGAIDHAAVDSAMQRADAKVRQFLDQQGVPADLENPRAKKPRYKPAADDTEGQQSYSEDMANYEKSRGSGFRIGVTDVRAGDTQDSVEARIADQHKLLKEKGNGPGRTPQETQPGAAGPEVSPGPSVEGPEGRTAEPPAASISPPEDARIEAPKKLARLQQHLDASDLPKRAREAHQAAIDKIERRISPTAARHLNENVQNYQILPSMEAVFELLRQEMQGKVKDRYGRGAVFGFYDSETSRIAVSSGSTETPLIEVHGHEMGHGIDGPDKRFSSTPEWDFISKEELNGRKLSWLAGQDAAEAFAEFSRRLHSTDVPTADIKATFPRAYEFWDKNGIAPEVIVGKKTGVLAKLKEAFGLPIVTETMRADTALKTEVKVEAPKAAEPVATTKEGLLAKIEADLTAKQVGEGQRKKRLDKLDKNVLSKMSPTQIAALDSSPEAKAIVVGRTQSETKSGGNLLEPHIQDKLDALSVPDAKHKDWLRRYLEGSPFQDVADQVGVPHRNTIKNATDPIARRLAESLGHDIPEDGATTALRKILGANVGTEVKGSVGQLSVAEHFVEPTESTDPAARLIAQEEQDAEDALWKKAGEHGLKSTEKVEGSAIQGSKGNGSSEGLRSGARHANGEVADLVQKYGGPNAEGGTTPPVEAPGNADANDIPRSRFARHPGKGIRATIQPERPGPTGQPAGATPDATGEATGPGVIAPVAVGSELAKPPVDHLANLAKAIHESDEGMQSIGAIVGNAADIAYQKAKAAVIKTKEVTDRLSGKMFPGLTRADRNTGEKTAQMAVAPTFAKEAAEHISDQVTGGGSWQAWWHDLWHPKEAEQFARLVGGTALETRFRYARNAFFEESRNASNDAAAARAAGDMDSAREFAQKATDYGKSGREVASFVGGTNSPFAIEADYQAALKNHKVQEALDRYKQQHAPLMEELYKKSVGLDPNDAINAMTQIADMPITAKAIEAKDADKQTVFTSGRGLKNLKMRRAGFAKEASLSHDAYELDIRKIIAHDLTTRAPLAAKAEALRAAVQGDVGEFGFPNSPREGYEEIPNIRPERDTQVNKLTGPPQSGFSTNRALDPGETSFYIKSDVHEEFYNALKLDKKKGWVEGTAAVAKPFTTIALAASVEAASHGANLMKSLMAPGVSPARLMANAYGKIMNTPEFRQKVMELSRQAMMKPRGMETGTLASAVGDLSEKAFGARTPEYLRYADPTFYASKVLDGLSEIMRTTLADAYDTIAINKGVRARLSGQAPVENTETGKRDFVNQLTGQYERSAQNGIISLLRDTGIGPFATAGSTFTVRGVKGLYLDPGVKATSYRSSLVLRAETFAKIASVLGAVMVTNHLLWGRSDGDDNTPFGAMKIGVDENGKTTSLDLLSLTGATRGLRAVGLLSQIEGSRQGKTQGEKNQKSIDDAIHALTHPAMGPLPTFLKTAATGKNNVGIPIAEKTPRGENHYAANLKAAALNANPVVAAFTGADHPGKEHSFSEKVAKMFGPFGLKYRAGKH